MEEDLRRRASGRIAANPADPWSHDPFESLPSPWAPPGSGTGTVPKPPTGDVSIPKPPKIKKPRVIPELDELYSVQHNLVEALGALDNFDHDDDDPDFHRFEYRLKNAYKVVNRWLRNYG